MDVYVDQDLCIGCELCVETAPDVFTMNDQGISVVTGEITANNWGNVQESIEACPTEAIKVRH